VVIEDGDEEEEGREREGGTVGRLEDY